MSSGELLTSVEFRWLITDIKIPTVRNLRSHEKFSLTILLEVLLWTKIYAKSSTSKMRLKSN